METRINLSKVNPDAYKAMLGLEAFLAKSGLNPLHKHLLKIRASQINGCAYCIDMHTQEARHDGDTERRLYNISAWQETPFFSPEERAILQLTEEITLITGRVSDETYNNALNLLGEKYLSEVIMAIVTINAWNRIGVSLNMMPA